MTDDASPADGTTDEAPSSSPDGSEGSARQRNAKQNNVVHTDNNTVAASDKPTVGNQPTTNAEGSSAEQQNGLDSAGDDPSLGGILGAESGGDDSLPRPSLEPETPQLENAVFVLVGVVFSILVIWRLVSVVT